MLYNLSQSKEASEIAIAKTKGWWLPKSVRHGKCWRQILTIGNVVVSLHLPYVVERRPQQEGKRKSVNQGFCPFLRWLGMCEGITPLVGSTIAEYGTMSSSFLTARSTLIHWGITISLKRIERLTYHFGQIGLSLRESKLFQLQQGTLPAGSMLKSQRVVIAVDGGRTRIRINKKGRRNSKTHRHGYVGEWVEREARRTEASVRQTSPKLLTIYAVDEKGIKIKNSQVSITNDGTYNGYQAFLKILEMHLISLGINQAVQVLLVADGAEWIWKHIPPILERLGCPKETYQLLDFYHVTEHLQDFADAAFVQDSERIKWFNQARKKLKQGKITALIDEMTALNNNESSESYKILTSQINYITKGHIEGRLNYDKIANLKLPLGSGAIESLIRQVVNLRLKGNGKFWLRNHAEIMLHARCQFIASNWNNFCDSILTAFINPATTG